ncbi:MULTISPECIES: hypothetical protein [Colwellia]|uniref:hypothetical protein n=1 Tax=Colwellia TaxID=28228 RepID=UPI00070A4587|nr:MULTISPECIES: hypothetical protein [Colwellia]
MLLFLKLKIIKDGCLCCFVRADKCGYIEKKQLKILNRLNISAENWLTLTTQFTRRFHGAVGHAEVLSDFCQHQALHRRTTLAVCNKLLA